MQREQDRTGAGGSAREHQVPPLLAGSTRNGKGERDNRRLLNPANPPLWTTKLREQTQRENQAEYCTPAHVQDLIARLVDVAREPIDEIEQTEIDRQRSNGDD